jgi:hypothetical protein
MSTTPASIKIAQTSASAAKKSGAPAGKQKTTVTRAQVYIVLGVLLVVAGGWWLKNHWTGPKSEVVGPGLNAPLSQVAAFVGTKDYKELFFERQRQYMQYLSKKDESGELRKAKGQLKPEQYSLCVTLSWLEGQLDHAEAYTKAKGIGPRNAILDKIIDKDEKKKNKNLAAAVAATQPATKPSKPTAVAPSKKKKPNPGQASKTPKVVLPPKEEDDKPDKWLSKELMEAWPPEPREKVLTFQTAIKDRKKYRDDKKKKDQAAAATQPATKPSVTPARLK